MKNFKIIIVLCTVVLFSCKEKTNSQSTPNKSELISAAEFKAQTDGKKVQLIDVRTPEEYAEGHIKEAVNINFYDKDFYTQMEALDKSKPVYVYCRSAGRSGKAAAQLKERGFTEIYDLAGGIIDWKKNNLEVVK